MANITSIAGTFDALRGEDYSTSLPRESVPPECSSFTETDNLDIMPLIYNSIECEHLPVQEKVLKLVPHLCEILDYGTVQNVLLVKVAVSSISRPDHVAI